MLLSSDTPESIAKSIGLGIIGFGQVGRRVAELVAPFKMRVLVYHPSCTDEPLPEYITKVKSVPELLPRVDILSLHCHLTPETRHLVNRDRIAQMRRGVHIINTARGALVHEDDLLEALQSGHVAGAALDVFAEEPPPLDHPLFQHDRVIVTAHVAGMSDNSFRNMGLAAVRHVLTVLKGEAVDPAVARNPEVL
jgi:D-3-phosphoglycerate dehydrogenase